MPDLSSVVENQPPPRVAVLIGIARYGNALPPLRSPVNDVTALAELLTSQHGYVVHRYCDEQATLAGLRQMLARLPALTEQADRVIIYFAGHGIAHDDDSADGPAGYILPQDARQDSIDSFLSMSELQGSLGGLECRHLLLILDCCFAGAFRWSQKRHARVLNATLYRERYDRYLRDVSWQVLCSAAYDEQALDVVQGKVLGSRGESEPCSPFASALCDGLRGAADLGVGGQPGDGVIVASELLLYIEERFRRQEECSESAQQRPSLWSLAGKDKGQFVFEVPGRTPVLPSALELTEGNNPYRGLLPYDAAQQHLFFGRQQAIAELVARVRGSALTVVVGASGTGKSSLVRAGLIPALASDGRDRWQILPVVRPGNEPMTMLAQTASQLMPEATSLASAVATWGQGEPTGSLLLVVDQLEELVTLAPGRWQDFLAAITAALSASGARLHAVFTLRTDFEPHFDAILSVRDGASPRFLIPPMSRSELREVVERPAQERVLYFEPPSMVDELLDEVVETPSSLPLLSFTLSELYRAYVKSDRRDRVLARADYLTLGGVAGALSTRADEVYATLDVASQLTLRNLMLRMVVSGQLTRRRLYKSELVFADLEQSQRYQRVLTALDSARLIVSDSDNSGQPYYEPAHDKLLMSWPRLRGFLEAAGGELPLRHDLAAASAERARGKGGWLLWSQDPRLPMLMAALSHDPLFFSTPERAFLQRSRLLRRLAAALVTAVVLGLSMLTLLAWWEARLAKKETQKHRRLLIQGYADQGRQLLLASQPDRAALWLTRALKESAALGVSTEGELSWARYALRDALRSVDAQQLVLMPYYGSARSIAYQPVAPYALVLTTGSEVAWLYRDSAAAADMPVRLVGHTSEVLDAQFDADGKQILTRSRDGQVRAWDAATGAPLRMVRAAGSPVTGVAGAVPHTLPAGTRCAELATLLGRAPVVAWSGDRSLVVVSRPDRSLGLWHVPSCTQISVLAGLGSPAVAAAFHPTGKAVAVVGQDQSGAIFETSHGIYQTRLTWNESRIAALAASADGTLLVLGTQDGLVRILQAQTGRRRHLLVGHRAAITAAAFRPDGSEVAVADETGTVNLWSTSTGALLARVPVTAMVKSLALSADGQLVTVSTSDTVRLVRRDGTLVSSVAGGASIPTAPSDSAPSAPSRRTFSLAPESNAIKSEAGEDRQQLPAGIFSGPAAQKGLLMALAADEYSLSGGSWLGAGTRYLLTWSLQDNAARVWDADKGLFQELEAGSNDQREEFLIGADSTRAWVQRKDHTLELWSTVPPARLRSYAALKAAKIKDSELVIMAQGLPRALLADDQGAVWLVDMGSGNLLTKLPADPQYPALTTFSFAEDEHLILTIHGQRMVRVWDERGQLRQRLPLSETQKASRARLSSDGQRLMTCGESNQALLWRLDLPKAAPMVITGQGAVETSKIYDGFLSSDSARLMVPHGDGFISLWDARAGNLEHLLNLHNLDPEDVPPSAQFSPDGSKILTAGTINPRVSVYDARSAALLAEIERNPAQIGWSMWPVFSPDGSRFLFLDMGAGTVRVYDAKTYKLLRVLGDRFDRIDQARFDRSSQYVITRSASETYRRWPAEAETRSPSQISELLRCRIRVRFDPDTTDTIVPNELDPALCACSLHDAQQSAEGGRGAAGPCSSP